jgi:TolA-binding protein
VFWFFSGTHFKIGIQTSGLSYIGVVIKPNVLEAGSIDLQKVTNAVSILQEMIRAQQSPHSPLQLSDGDAVAAFRPRAIPPLDDQMERPGRASPTVFVPEPVDETPVEPEPPPKREHKLPREKKAAKPRPKPTPNDLEAQDAFNAAVRVFESGRKKEAERAWRALIARWPESSAAKRALRILANRERAAQGEPEV